MKAMWKLYLRFTSLPRKRTCRLRMWQNLTYLLGTPIDERAVTYRPLDVPSNRVYVFKTDCFADIQDILTDGCSLWKGTGTKTFYAEKQDHGSIKLVVHPNSRQDIFTIERFYCHSQFKDVRSNFILIKVCDIIYMRNCSPTRNTTTWESSFLIKQRSNKIC